MGSTTYQSNFPSALYTGNLQDERITDDADVLARARDHNIHDVELRAIQRSIGTYPAGTLPTGSILRRLFDLEGGAGHDQVHSHDGADHSGTLSMDNVQINITNVMGTIINNWLTKVMGTGDLDADGVLTLQDVLTGVAINKEVLDDLILMGFDYPWQVPTGSGPGIPGGGGGGAGSPDNPIFGSGGGFDPGIPAMPITDIWTGLGSDTGGDYDQPVGLLVNFATGDQYGVWRYRTAAGTLMTGLRSTTNIGFADVWGAPAVGTNYGLFYFRKPSTVGITDDAGLVTNAIGALTFEDKQVGLTTVNEITALNFGDNVLDVPISPDLGANVTRSGWDGVDASAVGWCHVIDTPTGDGTVPARIVAPDSGTITIGVVTSSPANNAGVAVWNVRIQHKVGRVALSTVNANITADAILDTPQRDDIVSGLAVTKDDIININFIGLNTSPYNQAIILHGIFVEYETLT